MNSRIIIFLFVIALSIGAFSCEDVLDINDTTKLSDQAIWSSEKSADEYVTASYKTITDVSQVFNSRYQYFDSYSDIMKSTDWITYAPYNRALLNSNEFSTGSAGPLDCWANKGDGTDCYTRIRRANVLLDEIKRYGAPKFGEDWCNIRRAEIRLCRAFSYYRLARVYGGVIIRTDVSGVGGGLDDGANPLNVRRARATEAVTWDFIIDELRWAAEYLPDEWLPQWHGRATKIAAWGFISRMALYAKKWDVVIEAADKVKELGGDLAPDYAKVFKAQTDGSVDKDVTKELLFALYALPNAVTHNYDRQNRPFGDRAVYNTTLTADHVPTAELADLYEYKDGTAFNWNSWQVNHSDPFTDREPRFHATIMYNGCNWEKRVIQTYVGGSDGFSEFLKSTATDNARTCTGYYLRKYLQENNTKFVEERSYQYDAVLRYAEVLLNKAEAYAERDYLQYRDQALGALNEVRSRVKLPVKAAADAPDKEAFMNLLQKERCVELAGEGFRYWDLRRWKLAEALIHGQNVHGVKITKNVDNTYTYSRVACDDDTPRIFLEKYYYFSLPASELANNNLCKDNPYW